MHEHSSLDVPILANVDHDMLKTLINGAPAVLKPCLIVKRDEIRRDIHFNSLFAMRHVDDNQEEAIVCSYPYLGNTDP
ncbi:hypothetical protein WISP_50447 [Willisornis vidua]|uniref:Uncharacterized protein n=1 Tax=Willisornis vidua TaxID=1566151 RepID=A0ABQ9DDR3_9PASS|nr:hypothetical protein WISP_50447 [Willisornis vidua]